MPRIALCLIARDEERFIRDCLRSAREAVDQMIVVDTGSVDRTVEIAREEGATVVFHPWQDDFADARNAALPHVDADWILVLDADERLAPGSASRLRRVVRSARFEVGQMPLHNASRLDAKAAEILDGAARVDEPVLLPRLIRNGPGLRWEGVVHESVSKWVVEGNRMVQNIDIHIVHFGAVPELRVALDKGNRNLQLLEQRCALEPDDVMARTYLCRELLRVGDPLRAKKEIDRAWDVLRTQMEQPGPNPTAISTTMIRVHLALAAKDHELALQTILQTRNWNLNHPNLDLLEGLAWEGRAYGEHIDREALAKARECFLDATRHHGKFYAEEVIPGATSWAASTRLGVVLLVEGRADIAIDVLDAAIEVNPDYVDARLARIEALIDLGREREAIRELEPHLTPDHVDAWLLATAACVALEVERGARTFHGRLCSSEARGRIVSDHRQARRRAVEIEIVRFQPQAALTESA